MGEVPTEPYALSTICVALATTTCLWAYIGDNLPVYNTVMPVLPESVKEGLLKNLINDENVPQGKTKHKLSEPERFHRDFRIRSMGFVHSVATIFLGGSLCCSSYYLKHYFTGRGPLSDTIGFFSGGYFLWDICIILGRKREDDWAVWLLHGVLGFVNICPILFSQYPASWVHTGLLMSELSTPFMVLRWCYVKAGREKDSALVGCCFIAAFFLSRVVFCNFVMYYTIYKCILTELNNFNTAQKIMYFVAPPLFTTVNAYWFIHIIRVSRRFMKTLVN